MAAGQSSGSLEGIDYMHIEVDAVNSAGLTRTQELQTVAYQNSSGQNQRDNSLKQNQMRVEVLDEQIMNPIANSSALSFKKKQAIESTLMGQDDQMSMLKHNNQPMLLAGYEYGADDDDPEDDES